MESLLSFFHYGLSFLLIISVIVFIHEFGHYFVARLCGVKIETFSIGFGRELFGWNDKHGTRWKLSLLPLGGYVKMFGDANAASTPDAILKEFTEEEKKVSFHHKPLHKKAAVVVAGPVANFLLTIVILIGFFMNFGYPQTTPKVGGVLAGGAAEAAGVKPDDLFISIDGTPIERFEDVQRIVRIRPGEKLTTVIERDGAQITLDLVPERKETKDIFGNEVVVGQIGITGGHMNYVPLGPLAATGRAFAETWNMAADTLTAIGQIITGKRSTDELGGPIKIAKYSGQSASMGISATLWFMAVLSLNLGLINLFPIPMLDGGHLLYYGIEAVRGRPLAERIQEYGFRVGFGLLIMLMAFTTVNDVLQLNLF